MDERRQYKRYEAPYLVEAVGDHIKYTPEVIDLSSGGISFILPGEYVREEVVDLRIFLKEKMFFLTGKIVHIKPKEKNTFNVGVRFVDIPDDFRNTLEKEIEEIDQHRMESNLYERRELSFRKAAREYIEGGNRA